MLSFFKKKKENDISLEDLQMPEVTDYVDVSKIANYFKDETGLTFDKQTSILRNKLMIFCQKREINSFDNLYTKMCLDKVLKQELIDCLTTNETFFYREFSQIAKLVELVKQQTSSVGDIVCSICQQAKNLTV